MIRYYICPQCFEHIRLKVNPFPKSGKEQLMGYCEFCKMDINISYREFGQREIYGIEGNTYIK